MVEAMVVSVRAVVVVVVVFVVVLTPHFGNGVILLMGIPFTADV